MVTVRAPGTTANLGPGFDCLGAALTVSLSLSTDGTGERVDLVDRAISAIGDAPANYLVSSDVPVGRGLGSSAACVASGLLLGCELNGHPVDRDELLRKGTAIEGHPDNLAPALFGGITLVLPDLTVLRFEPAASVRPMLLVPMQSLSTEAARRALPDDVPRTDAIANIARSSGLLSMLTGAIAATSDGLLECTEDRIHQPYRARLMPQTADAVSYLRGHGIAAAVSGAGPSVVCLVLRGREDHVASAVSELEGWELLDVDWELQGAALVAG